MKKILYIIIPFIFWGCQKDFNSVIDSPLINYQASKVPTADSVTYSPSDSLMVLSVGLYPSADIQSVSANVISPDQTQLNNQPVILYDDGNSSDYGDTISGDFVFSNKFPMSHSYQKGKYQVQFFVTDNSGQTNMVALHFFWFDNGQPNVAPVISNIVAPDTVTLGTSTTPLFLSVQVHDDNGLSDVKSVYFNSYLPNGNASSGNPFKMYDDGSNGDKVAGDGIYSLTIGLPPNVTTGTYRFEFQAVDLGGLVSNKIVHNVVVK